MKAGLDTFAKKLEYFKKMNKLDDNDISTYQAVFDKADDDSSGEIDIHELHRIVLRLEFC